MNVFSAEAATIALPRRLLSSREVMAYFGYANRASFWQFVYANGVPHVRLGPRKIVFDEQQLADWIDRKRST